MQLRNKSTRRFDSTAIAAAIISLLIFGFSATSASAASPVVGPPSPNSPTAESIRVSKLCGADGSACQPAATQPDPVSAAPGKSTAPTSTTISGGITSGGATPDVGAGDGPDKTIDPAGSGNGPTEPAFVGQDPSLSSSTSGGASPTDANGSPLDVTPLTIPNFLINKFEIPPFLLPIYQACGTEYGVRWEVLAAINRIETNFGELATETSTAGAQGWMQFMPATWAGYGVDANGDKLKDPTNPVDAICAAANYLNASGYSDSPEEAVFAYNHADWYVDDVMSHARAYAAIPPELISALTGLTEGARFPVAAESTYDGEISTDRADNKSLASQDISSSEDRHEIVITSEPGAPVIAVNDGTISEIDTATGRIVLTDSYGNNYSYSGLGSIAQSHPVPSHNTDETAISDDPGDSSVPDVSAPSGEADMGAAKAAESPDGPDQAPTGSDTKPQGEPKAKGDPQISEVLVDPNAAAAADAADNSASDTSTSEQEQAVNAAEDRRAEQAALVQGTKANGETMNTEDMRGRVYANPLRPQNQNRATVEGISTKVHTPAASSSLEGKAGDYLIYDGSKSGVYRFDPETTDLKVLQKGSRVIAGTVLGRLVETPGASMNFAIKPGGENAPEIDPKPFLDGWKLLAETNIYNSKGGNRLADKLGVGGILLLSKPALQRRVLSDPGLDIYECGRQDIASGFTDRRVLAMLAFLRAKGFTMTITSLTCGHGTYSSSGYVSEHTTGDAIDIAVFNGEVVSAATQGPGSLTDQAARDVMSLQGAMAPHQVISLTDYGNGVGIAMGDHDDHLHVGFSPVAGSDAPGSTTSTATLGAEQWQRLTERLGEIGNPEIQTSPSSGAQPVGKSDKGK